MSGRIGASGEQLRGCRRRSPHARLLAGLIVATTLAATGCGEQEQILQPGAASGTYQGKPDGRPWENKPTSYGSSEWPQGDRGAWERAIKTRAQAQNEYVRTQ